MSGGVLTALFFMVALVMAGFYRFTYGLGASTNLSDDTPWGLWIGVDVMAGVALAAGGFTIAGAVYIFNLEKYKPVFKALSVINEKYNIHGAYQNHAGTRLGGPVWDLYRVLEGLNPDWIGCQYDIRHAVVEGGNSWPLGLQLIKPYVRCVDVKDFRWEKVKGIWKTIHVPLGEGMVDIGKFLGYLKEFEFKGPISLHIEYSMFNENEKSLSMGQKRKIAMGYMKHDMAYLKEKMSESGLS